MNKYLKQLTVVMIITTVFFSCTYNNSDYKLSENGVRIKFIEKGNNTTKAVEKDIVTVSLTYRVEDSIFYSSKNSENGTISFPITKALFKGDLYDALKLMGTGDSASIAIVADSFYLKTAAMPRLPRQIKPGSFIYMDVKLHEHLSPDLYQIKTQEQAREQAKQEKITLQKYLNDNKIYTDPTASGLYYLVEKEGSGSTPDTGDMCQINLSVKELGSDMFLYTNFGDRPLDFEYGGSFDTEGFREGIGLMRPGGKATLLVPSWIGVGSTGMEVVAPFTTLEYQVELLNIRTVEEVRKEREEVRKQEEIEKEERRKNEPERIAKYIKENNIDLEPLESGLFFKIIQEGSGNPPVDGDIVTLEYIHQDLNGNILQSSYDDNTPFTFEVGTGAVIKGWEEAVKLMPKGTKAWLLIPSKLGYAEHQRVRNIKPYTPLVFELEVTEIQ